MNTFRRVQRLLKEIESRPGVLPDRGHIPMPFRIISTHFPLDSVTYAQREEVIDLNRVVATQRTIDAMNIQKFLQDPSLGGLPLVTPFEDGYAIVDGHHRLAAARMRGETSVMVRIAEDAPANAAGTGAVAGLGVGPQGEPGVRRRRKKVDEAKAVVKRIATSTEHGVDFWQIGNDVYRAPTGIGKDSTGQPMGKRWECSMDHWRRYRSIFAWAQDINESAPDSFAGGDVFDVSPDSYARVRAPKKPWERYSRYLENEEHGEDIRMHARKQWKKNIILRDSRSGTMTYLRWRDRRGRV